MRFGARTRRYGLPRRGGATKLVALLLVLGLAGSFGATALVEAGVPGTVVLVLVVAVLAVPVVAAVRADRRDRPGREER